MAKSKREAVSREYTTKKGELIGFIKVTEPSMAYNKTGEYVCNILVSKEEAKVILELAKEIQEEQFNKYRKNNKKVDITCIAPYVKIKKDEKGIIIEETPDKDGRYLFKTKENAYVKDGKPDNEIMIYDSKLHRISNIKIGEGTIAKLGVTLKGYSTNLGTGVSAKLKVIQIIDLVEYTKSASSFGLTEEEGFKFSKNDEVEEKTDIEDDEEEDF